MKCVTDIIESGAVVDLDPDRVQIHVSRPTSRLPRAA
jgi:hypothetical protein